MGSYKINKQMGRGLCPQNTPCGAEAEYVATKPRLNLYKTQNHNFIRRHTLAPARSSVEILGSKNPSPQSVGQPFEVHTVTARIPVTDIQAATDEVNNSHALNPLSLSQSEYQHPATLSGLRSRSEVLEASRTKPPSG